MDMKIYGMATAIAFAFTAGLVQAQSTATQGSTADKPRSAAGATASDRKARDAEEDRIEAEYKAAKAKCDAMKGNEQDVCEKEAKGKEKVAKAELNAKNNPSERNQRKVQEAKAEAQYDLAKEKCDAMKGDQKDACQKQAKAEHDRAKADMKRAEAKSERRQSGSGTTAPRTSDKPAKGS
jgi:hypothetical protein